jgi:hypothetical protein
VLPARLIRSVLEAAAVAAKRTMTVEPARTVRRELEVARRSLTLPILVSSMRTEPALSTRMP